MQFHRLKQSVGCFSGMAEMAWDVLSGAVKMPWDVLSVLTKTALDVLSGIKHKHVNHRRQHRTWPNTFVISEPSSHNIVNPHRQNQQLFYTIHQDLISQGES